MRSWLESEDKRPRSPYPDPLMILAALAAYGATKFSLSLRTAVTPEYPSIQVIGDLGLGRERSYRSRASNFVNMTFMDAGVIKGKNV